MINEAYENGQITALQEIEKVAGYEFAEKVAGKSADAWKAIKSYGNKAKESVMNQGYKAKSDAMSAATGFKHKYGKGTKMRDGMSHTMDPKSRSAVIGKTLGRAALIGGAGYGAKKGLTD